MLDGGLGNDTMDGGTGNDTYVVNAAGDIVMETSAVATEIDTVKSAVTWTLGANLENLTLTGTGAINGTGNSLANTLTGNAAANVLSGGSGNDILDGGLGDDTMIGGAGNDTYVVDIAADVDHRDSTPATEIDTVQARVSWTLGANLENLTLTGTAAINGTGNALANVPRQRAPTAGRRRQRHPGRRRGRRHDDRRPRQRHLRTSTPRSTSSPRPRPSPTEIDTVKSAVTWTLGANLENLTLTGASAINGTGNTLANTITGNAAAQHPRWRPGQRHMIGGLGNDTYVVDAALDMITETSAAATEIDTVQSAVTWTLGANLENLTLTGTAAINGTGNTLANILTGNAAANTLSGGTGNDTLIGGLGNDRLTGSTGLDTFRFTGVPNATTNADIITDFLAADDRIQLDDAAFAGIGPVGALAAAAFYAGAAAHDASDRIIYNKAAGKLYFDADGNAAGAQVLFATVTAGTALTIADLFVI